MMPWLNMAVDDDKRDDNHDDFMIQHGEVRENRDLFLLRERLAAMFFGMEYDGTEYATNSMIFGCVWKKWICAS